MKKRKKKKESLIKNIQKVFKLTKKSTGHLIAYVLISAMETAISIIVPLVGAKVILNITSGLMEQLLYTAFIVFDLDLISYLLSYFKSYFYRKIYLKALVALQLELAKETLKLEVEEMDKESSGMFIDRLNKDTADLASMFMEYSYYITKVVTNMGVLVTIFILNKYLFIHAVITSLAMFIIDKVRLAKMFKTKKELKIINEQKTGLTGEIVRGIRDIKVLNASKNMLEQTGNKIAESAEKERSLIKISRLYDLVYRVVQSVCDFCFIVIGCLLYKNNLLTIPAFVIIFNYQGRVKNLLSSVSFILEYNKKFELASGRLFEIIDNTRFKKETFGDKTIDNVKGHIEFKNVTFGYDKHSNVLDKISFDIKPNERVAFVGKSGAGKTTIFSLLSRLYHHKSGKILIDGYDINELTESSLRDNISLITQMPYIFNLSIKENLLLVKPDATMKEIKEACKLACMDDFIMTLPKKYNTIIGENGVILSGGQRQRLAIARALLMKTKIILFDEATSALDNETQKEINNAIDNLKGEYTILIVAHRLSTVIDSDRIFVIENGKVLDEGTHNELMKKCKFYKELYESEI